MIRVGEGTDASIGDEFTSRLGGGSAALGTCVCRRCCFDEAEVKHKGGL